MGIDALIGEGDKGLKVTDLVVPDVQETSPLFDTEKHITEDDWQMVKNYFSNMLGTVDTNIIALGDISEMLYFTVVHRSLRRNELPLDRLNQKLRRPKVRTLSINKDLTDELQNLVKRISGLILLDPSFRKFVPQIDKEYPHFLTHLGSLKEKAQRSSSSRETVDLLWVVMRGLIVYPDLLTKFPLTQDLFHKALLMYPSTDLWLTWLYWVEALTPLAVLFPDKKGELPLDQRFWHKSIEEFDTIRKDHGGRTFINYATNLGILAAKRATIRNGQFIFENDKPLVSNLPVIPVRRGF